MDSEGLLLFTNDGDFSQMLTHPSHQVDKRYRVWVRGYTRRREEALRRPVSLDGYTIRPPGVRFLHRQGEMACLEVVIHEGRNRQIRRMCGMAGLEVTRLQRVGEGPLRLGGLPLGAWRYLTPEELTMLRQRK
ncbi:pseudouridine synthase [Firmicutes bacterium CAG:137]|nr:pseudouridine synthase [Firmicutes bacterium CAG:137]